MKLIIFFLPVFVLVTPVSIPHFFYRLILSLIKFPDDVSTKIELYVKKIIDECKDDADPSCLFACVFKKEGFLDDNGKINQSTAKDAVKRFVILEDLGEYEEELINIVEFCTDTSFQKEETCHTADAINACLKNKTMADILITLILSLIKFPDDVSTKIELYVKKIIDECKDDADPSCLFACVFKKEGFLDDNGKINQSAAKDAVKRFVILEDLGEYEEELINIVEFCTDTSFQKEETCHTADAIHVCLKNKTMADILITLILSLIKFPDDVSTKIELYVKKIIDECKDDADPSCLFACVFKKEGFLDDNGKINQSAAKDAVKRFVILEDLGEYEEELINIVEFCTDTSFQKEETCHTADAINACLKNKTMADILITLILSLIKFPDDVSTKIELYVKKIIDECKDDADPSCLFACVFKKEGFLDDNGKINQSAAKDAVKRFVILEDLGEYEEELINIVEFCTDTSFQKEETCHTADAINACLKNKTMADTLITLILSLIKFPEEVYTKIELYVKKIIDECKDDADPSCLFACVFKKEGFLDDNGKIHQSAAKDAVKRFVILEDLGEYEEELINIVEFCTDTSFQKDETCHTADAINACLKNKTMADILITQNDKLNYENQEMKGQTTEMEVGMETQVDEALKNHEEIIKTKIEETIQRIEEKEVPQECKNHSRRILAVNRNIYGKYED
ncbi:hypothetical protein FQR65_LT07510 [Abscondita terminalis]|nr:hypothetical protein FQR65_LT07510 [Abscondita terminalis]